MYLMYAIIRTLLTIVMVNDSYFYSIFSFLFFSFFIIWSSSNPRNKIPTVLFTVDDQATGEAPGRVFLHRGRPRRRGGDAACGRGGVRRERERGAVRTPRPRGPKAHPPARAAHRKRLLRRRFGYADIPRGQEKHKQRRY